uniref:non-specific serine/threonine protein kinase n=1 Tax=Chromera velia CCMP2878 TaxID=1169474 RepID=A0A0G4HZS6_9ALVE|eukprot:Cvel_9761.t1-p1 / transcript=Cvel_9761.t1 / gene=Cvel_9761 / organism=Chromera_velia_CCMP2878 / gene_product=Calcium-dependent protein kinase 3, putative / transcript_product=Calcium-dependent protein kinase 3, putative / location=Cvel_scaffold571:68798-76284(+) / protein_length=1011 / sequence_SO=supercontig / SO=protein_coding / is_pseudo=false
MTGSSRQVAEQSATRETVLGLINEQWKMETAFKKALQRFRQMEVHKTDNYTALDRFFEMALDETQGERDEKDRDPRLRLSEPTAKANASLSSISLSFTEVEEFVAIFLHCAGLPPALAGDKSSLCSLFVKMKRDDLSSSEAPKKEESDYHFGVGGGEGGRIHLLSGRVPGDSLKTLIRFFLCNVRDEYFPPQMKFRRDRFITSSKKDVDEVYERLEKLGAGQFGSVYRVRERKTGLYRTCKVLPKGRASVSAEEAGDELEALRRVDHPNILRIFECFEDRHNIYLICELLEGVELERLMIAQVALNEGRASAASHFSLPPRRDNEESSKEGGSLEGTRGGAQKRQQAAALESIKNGNMSGSYSLFPEPSVARMVQAVLSAVAHCHDQHIMHKDLKPSNIIVLSKGVARPPLEVEVIGRHRDGTPFLRECVSALVPGHEALLKVVDFGLAEAFSPLTPSHVHSLVAAGSPYYMAPEVFDGIFEYKSDVWSAGVILYALLSGFLPFAVQKSAAETQSRSSRELLKEAIQQKETPFPPEIFSNISSDAIEAVKVLLEKDPLSRPRASEALKLPFFRRNTEAQTGGDMDSRRGDAIDRVFILNRQASPADRPKSFILSPTTRQPVSLSILDPVEAVDASRLQERKGELREAYARLWSQTSPSQSGGSGTSVYSATLGGDDFGDHSFDEKTLEEEGKEYGEGGGGREEEESFGSFGGGGDGTEEGEGNDFLSMEQLRRRRRAYKFLKFARLSPLRRVLWNFLAMQAGAESADVLRAGNIFRALDRSGDGLLQFEELEEGLREIGVPEDDIEKVAHAIDVSGEGEVSITEWLAVLLCKETAEIEGLAGAAFRKLDRDGDGFISRRDLSVFIDEGDSSGKRGRRQGERAPFVVPGEEGRPGVEDRDHALALEGIGADVAMEELLRAKRIREQEEEEEAEGREEATQAPTGYRHKRTKEDSPGTTESDKLSLSSSSSSDSSSSDESDSELSSDEEHHKKIKKDDEMISFEDFKRYLFED